MQTLTHMTRADMLARYITAPENEVMLKELLVRVTNKLADGQAGERTGLGGVLHKFCASKIFARAGASVTCVTCEQFCNLVDIGHARLAHCRGQLTKPGLLPPSGCLKPQRFPL